MGELPRAEQGFQSKTAGITAHSGVSLTARDSYPYITNDEGLRTQILHGREDQLWPESENKNTSNYARNADR
jgi:hypothetical protein